MSLEEGDDEYAYDAIVEVFQNVREHPMNTEKTADLAGALVSLSTLLRGEMRDIKNRLSELERKVK